MREDSPHLSTHKATIVQDQETTSSFSLAFFDWLHYDPFRSAPVCIHSFIFGADDLGSMCGLCL